MPSVSVIVPVYKVEDYLERCLDSILSQTFSDFELILVDDGSPDRCGIICDEYKEKDPRIKVIHKENGGLSDARNKGIDIAQGEYLSFVDSDDWIHPQYLELLIQANEKNCTLISICDLLRTDRSMDPDIIGNPNIKLQVTRSFFREKNVQAITACGALYRKELFSDIHFPVGRIHEDEFTTYKLLFKTEFISYVDEKLYYYFDTPGSITNRPWSLKRVDGLDALVERYNFFVDRGEWDLAEYTMRCFDNLNYMSNIIARKNGMYKNYPRIYKRSFVKSAKYLMNNWGVERYEAFMNEYYPTFAKIHRVYRKLRWRNSV